jgi:hypothetical protein
MAAGSGVLSHWQVTISMQREEKIQLALEIDRLAS